MQNQANNLYICSGMKQSPKPGNRIHDKKRTEKAGSSGENARPGRGGMTETAGQRKKADRQGRAPDKKIRPGGDKGQLPEASPDAGMRLNRFIAHTGICSRREADELILAGHIKVNGKTVTGLGTRVNPSDSVNYRGKPIQGERKIYILLNKPKDCLTTVKDTHGRKTVMDLVRGCCQERIYPVGRLDRNTTGVLLLTNDGDLAEALSHPSHQQKKIYHIYLDRPLEPVDMQKLSAGLELEDGFIRPDRVEYVDASDRSQLGLEIHSGRNRIVRRIFERLGYRVIRLDRVYYAGLTKKGLSRGRWRHLSPKEVGMLKMSVPRKKSFRPAGKS
jgi:23S rRNA pseudouridine2605 synthase